VDLGSAGDSPTCVLDECTVLPVSRRVGELAEWGLELVEAGSLGLGLLQSLCLSLLLCWLHQLILVVLM
jgi:hypothetical protein